MKENIFSGIIKDSFETIDGFHKKNYITQVNNVVDYQKMNFPRKKTLIDFLSDILKLEEKIFWCIDDVIDNQYDDRKVIIYNEIVEFVSFIQMFDKILDYQMKNKSDFSNIIFKKGIIAERILSSIKENIMDLVNIPHNEKIFNEKMYKEDNEYKVISIILQNQLNRAQNVKIYLGTAEAVCGNKINYKPFLFLRAMQLLRGDLEDIEEDSQNNNNNIFNMLMEKYGDHKKAERIIISVAEKILDELSKNNENPEFFLKRAKKEKII